MSQSIDLGSDAFWDDPYPAYRQLQELDQLYWYTAPRTMSGGMWMISRYDEVSEILKLAHTTKDVSRFIPPENMSPFDHNMLSKDPPDHTRLRSLAGRAFTPQRVRQLTPRITEMVDALLDRAEADGGLDFVSEFALPLPVNVIAELLGIPESARSDFSAWSQAIFAGSDSMSSTDAQIQAAGVGYMKMHDFLFDLIADKRRTPGEDMTSALIEARDEGDKLSEFELVGMCMLLLIAGHETTYNLLGNGLFALLENRDQLELLRADPALMPTAIEEMLRFYSPVQRATFRFSTKPITMRDTEIETLSSLGVLLGAANRDPRRFPNPDRFDITRKPNKHLAFGLGIHFCLGAPLARLEAQIGFSRLLERFKTLHLVDPAPKWRPGSLSRGLDALPIEF